MKKQTAIRKSTAPATSKPDGFAPLIAEVRSLIQSARHAAASTVNTLQVLTNFEIGRRIVKHEQKGEKRAGYGKALLKELSARLTEEFGRGFSEDNLSNMRRFYLTWCERVSEFPRSLLGNWEDQIFQKPSGKSLAGEIFQEPSEKSLMEAKVQKLSAQFALEDKSQKPSDQLAISAKPSRKSPFTLS